MCCEFIKQLQKLEYVTYETIMQENQISLVFRNFPVYTNDTNRKGRGVLLQNFSEA